MSFIDGMFTEEVVERVRMGCPPVYKSAQKTKEKLEREDDKMRRLGYVRSSGMYMDVWVKRPF